MIYARCLVYPNSLYPAFVFGLPSLFLPDRLTPISYTLTASPNTLMALSHSPRKLVPLTVGDERPSSSRFKPTQPRLTRRVFFCGVVVENAEHGQELSPGACARGQRHCWPLNALLDVQDLVASLGDPLDLGLEASPLPPSNSSTTDLSQAASISLSLSSVC